MIKVPHLNTALNGPLLELEKICLNLQIEIERWFRNKWQQHKAPFYGSVDLRNSGFKLAPVDMNLFPGGFNNLNHQFSNLASQAVSFYFEKNYHNACSVLLIPENHTRNKFYLQNVDALKNILSHAGIEVKIGTIQQEELSCNYLDAEKFLTYHPIIKKDNYLITKDGYEPCLILLNNDLSAGVPELLKNIDQTIVPPLVCGWHNRKKTDFFAQYDIISQEFAQLIAIDPWKINPYFDHATTVNFALKQGIEELSVKVDQMLLKIQKKYQEYGIKEQPYVIVKANNGTYGMGIMVVKSGLDILEINRRERNKMAIIKDGINVNDVIIQEGVHSFEEIEDKVAEPVVYMIDNFVVGGFYRVHPEKAKDENLNAVGAEFIPLSFADVCLADKLKSPTQPPNRFYTYGVIARLALLASSLEITQLCNPIN